MEEPARLPTKTVVLRELYLFSGNRCAFPDCSEALLDGDGTLNSQVAHIRGVAKTSARFDAAMSNEERRQASNLLILCLKHHNSIDDKKLEAKYTVAVVTQMKEMHESRFRASIGTLEAKLVDLTEIVEPIYAKSLGAIEAYDEDHLVEDLGVINSLLESLAKWPPSVREVLAHCIFHGRIQGYAPGEIALTYHELEQSVAGISEGELYRSVRVLEANQALSFDEDEENPGIWLHGSWTGEGEWDVFLELKKIAGSDRNRIRRAIVDLDFTVFDDQLGT